MNIDEAIEAKAYKDGYEQGKKDASTVAYKLSPTEPLTNCQQWIPVSERLRKNGRMSLYGQNVDFA